MEHSYVSSELEAKKHSPWRLVADVLFWCVGGLVLITCGWPFALVYIIISKRRQSEVEQMEYAVHKCPKCKRVLGRKSPVCPRCGHRFNEL